MGKMWSNFCFFRIFPIRSQALENRKKRSKSSLSLKKVIFWHYFCYKIWNFRDIGLKLEVILALPRFISHTKKVGVGSSIFSYFWPINGVFWLFRVEKIRRKWIFNVLWYVSMWFPMLPELIQVILGYIKTFPQGCPCGRGFLMIWMPVKEVT